MWEILFRKGENQGLGIQPTEFKTIPCKAPTCTETGLTKGCYCSVCGEVLLAQKIIPAKGHRMGRWHTIKEATKEECGLKERTCICCDYTETKVINKISNTEYEYVFKCVIRVIDCFYNTLNSMFAGRCNTGC